MARQLASAWVSIAPTGFADFAKKAREGIKTALKGADATVPVKADTKPAGTELDKLKARLKDFSKTVVTARASVDTKQAAADLAKIDVRLDRLSHKVSSPRITLEGIKAAEAELLGFEAQLDRVNRKSARGDGGGGGAGIGSALLGPGIITGGAGLLAASAPVAAAGAAMAAFAAVAIPTLKSTFTASTKNAQAQTAYANSIAKARLAYAQQMAVAEKALAQAKTAQQRQAALNQEHAAAAQLAKAEAGAQLTLSQNTTKLSAGQQALQAQVKDLGKLWGGLQRQLAPVVLSVTTLAVKIASDLMPTLKILATAGGQALQAILVPLGKLFQSGAWSKFITGLASLAKQAAPVIGTLLVGALQGLMNLIQQLGPVGLTLLKELTPLFLSVLSSAVPIVRALASALSVVLGWLKPLNPVIAPIAVSIYAMVKAFQLVKGAITGLNVALKIFDIELAANPIGIVVVALAALAVGFSIAWKKSAAFRDVIKSIAGVMLGVGIVVLRVNKAIIDSFLSVIGTILHGLATAFGWIPGGVGNALKSASKHFDNFKAGTDNVINGLIRNMQGWQRELNASKETVAQATADIVKHFRGQGDAARISGIDLARYTAAIRANHADTDAGRGARNRLISDLIGSGVSARNAKTLVDNLQRSISNMHGKNVTVGVTGTGHGGVVITASGLAAAGQGNIRFHSGNFAAGGLVRTGTGPTADDVIARLSKGELVVPAAMVKGGAVDHLRGAIPGFAAGGLAGMAASLPGVPGRAAGFAARGAAAAELAGVRAAIAREKAALTAAGGIGNYHPGAGVQQWRGVVSRALSLAGSSQQLVDAVLYQMQTESGGNPRAVNLWDSNAKAGHPSVGLMQVIAGTFAAYAGRFRNTGPFAYGVSENPLANVFAAIKYAQANYGPGLRNSYGGIGTGRGYDHGGYLPPGLSLAWNGTGRPEPVGPTAGGDVHLHLTVTGPVGSRAELENWFVMMANQTARTGRLDQAVKRASRG